MALSLIYATLLVLAGVKVARMAGGLRGLQAVMIAPGLHVGAVLDRARTERARRPRSVAAARLRQARAHMRARRVPCGPRR